MNIGFALKEFREKAGLSLRQLEAKTGLKAQYISSLEIGKKKSPSIDNLQLLATALNISVIDLFLKSGYTTSKSTDIETSIQMSDLTTSQKEALLGVYRSYKNGNGNNKPIDIETVIKYSPDLPPEGREALLTTYRAVKNK